MRGPLSSVASIVIVVPPTSVSSLGQQPVGQSPRLASAARINDDSRASPHRRTDSHQQTSRSHGALLRQHGPRIVADGVADLSLKKTRDRIAPEIGNSQRSSRWILSREGLCPCAGQSPRSASAARVNDRTRTSLHRRTDSHQQTLQESRRSIAPVWPASLPLKPVSTPSAKLACPVPGAGGVETEVPGIAGGPDHGLLHPPDQARRVADPGRRRPTSGTSSSNARVFVPSQPSAKPIAAQTSSSRAAESWARRRLRPVVATVTRLWRLTAQGCFIPSSTSSTTSEGTPRMVEVIGATVTRDR